MSDSVKVSVVKYADRDHLVLRWKDPISGKPRCKTSGTSRRREAERAAANLEREILEGQHGPAARMNWSDFREYHERHCLAAMKPKSFDAYVCALNVYESFHKPDRMSDITAARVTAWQTHLRSEGKAEATIATYTRHLKAVLNWAKSQGLLAVVPKLVMPKRVKSAKVMKGRPITTEEFERMLSAVAKVVGEDAAPSWKYYLRGLWWSGLRLSESLILEWGGITPGAAVDFTGRRPMLRIPAESEKGGQDRLLPIAPEFAAILQETQEGERHGRVFKLIGKRWADARMQADWVGRVVCQIGRGARVVVDQRERRLVADTRSSRARPKPESAAKAEKRKSTADVDDGIKRKHASAHDLRRAFGLRWSSRLMPADLQKLMRHESIETTMRYYVGRDSDALSDMLFAAVETATPRVATPKSNKTGNKQPNSQSESAKVKPQTLAN